MDPNNTTPPADGGTPPPDPASSLMSATPPADPPTPGPNDWLPAKFHVNKDDGTFDEAASARKLAESYTALESHKGPMLKAPDSPEGYKITAPVDAEGKPIEGLDLDEFVKDPLFTGLAAKAHAKGIPNEHLEFFVHEYLQIAPDMLNVSAELTIEEASAELSKLWGDKPAFDANIKLANRATQEFTKDIADDQPGSFKRVFDKFRNDPDFMAMMARIGTESKFGEDTPPGAPRPPSGIDAEALMKGEAYWNPQHPDHARVKSQVETHFKQVHGTAAHR